MQESKQTPERRPQEPLDFSILAPPRGEGIVRVHRVRQPSFHRRHNAFDRARWHRVLVESVRQILRKLG